MMKSLADKKGSFQIWRIFLFVLAFFLCLFPLFFYKYYEHERLRVCEPNEIVRYESSDFEVYHDGDGRIEYPSRKVYKYHFTDIPGYSAMRIMADGLSREDFDYEILTKDDHYFSVKDDFESNIEYELGDETIEAEVFLWSNRDIGVSEIPPHIYASNCSYIKEKLKIAIICCLGMFVCFGVVLIALRRGWKPIVLKEMSIMDRRLGCILAAIIVGLALLRAMLTSRQGTALWRFNSENKANLKDYFIVITVVFVISMLTITVTEILSKKRVIKGLAFSRGLTLFIMALFGITVLIMCRIGESNGFAFRIMVYFAYLLLLLSFLQISDNVVTRLSVYVAYAITIIAAGVDSCVVNYFDDLGDVHHAGAYIWPVLEILDGKPFAGGEEDLYGHYALFIAPILKLIGANSLTFALVMGALGAMTAFMMIKIINNTISSDSVRILAAIAVLQTWMGYRVYWQTIPHRWIFPTFILYFITIQSKKDLEEKQVLKNLLPGYLICMTAMLWNNESGAVCGITWAAYVTLMGIEDKGRSLMQFVCRGVLQIGLLLLEFLLAYGIVGLYNYIASGFDTVAVLGISEYLGILMNDAYMVDYHMTLWNWDWSEWIFIFAFSLGIVITIFAVTGVLGEEPEIKCDTKTPIMASIISLGLFTFFVNRTAAGFGMSLPFFCLAGASILDNSKGIVIDIIGDRQQTKRRFIYLGGVKEYFSLAKIVKALSVMAIMAYFSLLFVSFPGSLRILASRRFDGVRMNYTLLRDELDDFEETIPYDATFSGFELSTVALNLGRNMTVTDDTPYVVTLGVFDSPYELVREITIGEMEFRLYYDTRYIQ